MLDIVAIREAIKSGELKIRVRDGVIFLHNDINECVKIGHHTGHWISNENDDLKVTDYTCSECGYGADNDDIFKYCPICGSYNGGYNV